MARGIEQSLSRSRYVAASDVTVVPSEVVQCDGPGISSLTFKLGLSGASDYGREYREGNLHLWNKTGRRNLKGPLPSCGSMPGATESLAGRWWLRSNPG